MQLISCQYGKTNKSLDCGRHFDFPGGGRVAKYRSFCSHNISRKSHGSVPVNSMRLEMAFKRSVWGYFYPPNYHMRVKIQITLMHN